MTSIQRDVLTIQFRFSGFDEYVSFGSAGIERDVSESVNVVEDTSENVTAINSMDVKCIIIRKRALDYRIVGRVYTIIIASDSRQF